jgi:hypothetical protein
MRKTATRPNQHLQATRESGFIPCWATMARVSEWFQPGCNGTNSSSRSQVSPWQSNV